ncbi:hypothetical protein [Paenibacillus lutrae]|uniref:Uncharacterized protein n=1 Tax=Paenibacillus lutrae TaxID=2078573 RepID=A0A7X3K160_9BACL|nr:hypothetical protein [Paenibacillus lutrae]MVP01641.1 hypothetical protein [Paenibacillus lutrae]
MDDALSNYKLLQERSDRKMNPFFWILTFECMVILLLAGTAVAAGPVYWAFTSRTVLSFLSLLLILPGLWLVRFSFRTLKSAVWKNNHLSEYKLYENEIRFAYYEEKTRREGSISMKEINRVYVGYYMAPSHYAYEPNVRRKKQLPTFHLLPMLFIRYREAAQTRVLQIPFHDLIEMKRWLKYFGKLKMPVWATDLLLAERTEEEQLLAFDQEEDARPFSVEERGFSKRLDSVMKELDQKRRERLGLDAPREQAAAAKTRRGTASGGKFIAPVSASGGLRRTTSHRSRPYGKQSRDSWKLSSFFIFGLLFSSLPLLVLMAIEGSIHPENMGISLLFLLAAGAVYFLLAERLRFMLALRYCLIAFIGWVMTGAMMPQTDEGVGSLFYENAVGAALLLPFTIWLPFLLIWLVRKYVPDTDEHGQPSNLKGRKA